MLYLALLATHIATITKFISLSKAKNRFLVGDHLMKRDGHLYLKKLLDKRTQKPKNGGRLGLIWLTNI